MNPRIAIDHGKINTFCRKWRVAELALFGSVLRDDFGPESDVDVLVTFSPDARRTLFDLVDMKDELSAIFQREVDVVSKRAIQASPNPYRKEVILSQYEVLYAA
jgi:predicted nucleotidyltransferase